VATAGGLESCRIAGRQLCKVLEPLLRATGREHLHNTSRLLPGVPHRVHHIARLQRPITRLRLRDRVANPPLGRVLASTDLPGLVRGRLVERRGRRAYANDAERYPPAIGQGGALGCCIDDRFSTPHEVHDQKNSSQARYIRVGW